MAYVKEQRWRIEYGVPTANGNESIKSIVVRSEDKKKQNLDLCKQYGYRVVSCKKLYPFSTEKNQHNFMLIANICSNRMYDMRMGNEKMNDAEYERLEDLKYRADEYFCLPLPVAWIPWEEWQDAKELAQMAVIHRQNVCVENGRPDLVKYC